MEFNKFVLIVLLYYYLPPLTLRNHFVISRIKSRKFLLRRKFLGISHVEILFNNFDIFAGPPERPNCVIADLFGRAGLSANTLSATSAVANYFT